MKLRLATQTKADKRSGDLNRCRVLLMVFKNRSQKLTKNWYLLFPWLFAIWDNSSQKKHQYTCWTPGMRNPDPKRYQIVTVDQQTMNNVGSRWLTHVKVTRSPRRTTGKEVAQQEKSSSNASRRLADKRNRTGALGNVITTATQIEVILRMKKGNRQN